MACSHVCSLNMLKIIALDGTMRPRPGDEQLAELIEKVHGKLNNVLVHNISYNALKFKMLLIRVYLLRL